MIVKVNAVHAPNAPTNRSANVLCKGCYINEFYGYQLLKILLIALLITNLARVTKSFRFCIMFVFVTNLNLYFVYYVGTLNIVY